MQLFHLDFASSLRSGKFSCPVSCVDNRVRPANAEMSVPRSMRVPKPERAKEQASTLPEEGFLRKLGASRLWRFGGSSTRHVVWKSRQRVGRLKQKVRGCTLKNRRRLVAIKTEQPNPVGKAASLD